MSFLFFGLGAGNRVVNLNMVVLLGLWAERERRRRQRKPYAPIPSRPLVFIGCDVGIVYAAISC